MLREVDDDLPGHDLVREGLDDLGAGRESECSLLVAMAAPRLRAIGFDVPPGGGDWPSHRLYELLSDQGSGAHGRYNALVARIVSFARAAEHASARCGARRQRRVGVAARFRPRAPGLARPQPSSDVASMIDRGLVDKQKLRQLYDAIEAELYRYLAIDPDSFRRKLDAVLN